MSLPASFRASPAIRWTPFVVSGVLALLLGASGHARAEAPTNATNALWGQQEILAGAIAAMLLLAAAGAVALLWRQNRRLRGMTNLYREAALNLRVAASAFDGQQGLLVVDEKAHILRANRAFLEMTGYVEEEVVGQNIAMFQSEMLEPRFLAKLYAHLATSDRWSGEAWCRRKDGSSIPCWSTVTAVKDEDGDTVRYVDSFTDISERKQAEAEVRQLAFFDTVTELPNRRLFLDRLGQAVHACERTDTRGAVFFVDLDNFKTLNDTHGHAVGDELLRQVAQRLGKALRSSDTLARLGGDEFVVMLTNLDPDMLLASTQASGVAETVRELVRQPYELMSSDETGAARGLTYTCSASIGVTLFGEADETADDIMRRADAAMYQSKRGGRDAVSHFDPDLQVVLTQRAHLKAELTQALQQQELLLHFQVQTNAGGVPVGAEALLRWSHPQRGMVAPDVFIPVAEESGAIVAMGYWVLRAACETLARWARQPACENLTLSVNLSPRQFGQPDFLKQLELILQETGADPRHLMLEITEGLILGHVEQTIPKMQKVCALGVSFSIDDFGTGYSSLSYLQRLPLRQLKIDRAFVRDLVENPNDQAIVRAILSLGLSLGLEVVAEGVETPGQRDLLVARGCPLLQGYLLGRPLPLADFEQALQASVRS